MSKDEAPNGDDAHDAASDDAHDVASATRRDVALLLPHHRWLALGATTSIIGLVLVGVRPEHEPIVVSQVAVLSDFSAAVVLIGLLTLVYSIHRYGRLGAG